MLAHIVAGWVEFVRTVQIAAYGVLFGLSLYILVHAISEYRQKADRFNGEMWRVVVWLEAGVTMLVVVGFVARYQLLVSHGEPDLRFYLVPFAQGPLLFAQLLALRFIRRRARKEGSA